MTYPDNDESQIRWATLAGFMYLFVDFAYRLGMFIACRFEVSGDFTEAAHEIMRSELFYRIGLTSVFIAALSTVFFTTGLYVALKPVDKNLVLLDFNELPPA